MSKQQLNNDQLAPVWKTWTPTLGGFSVVPPIAFYRYILIGKMCTVSVMHTSTDGTSNSTAFTISLPFTSANITNMQWTTVVGQVRDNSTTLSPGLAIIGPNTTTMTLYRTTQGSTWTASGGKRVAGLTITYEIA